MRLIRRSTSGRRRSVRTAVEMASLCVTVFAILSAPAHAMTISETRICTTGTSDANTNTCVDVYDSGRYIDHIEATAKVDHVGRRLKICVHGPSIDRCNGTHYVGPFDTLVSTWTPRADERAGQYEAVTYRLNNDGTYTKIGVASVTIG